jgi:hypothetical protein
LQAQGCSGFLVLYQLIQMAVTSYLLLAVLALLAFDATITTAALPTVPSKSVPHVGGRRPVRIRTTDTIIYPDEIAGEDYPLPIDATMYSEPVLRSDAVTRYTRNSKSKAVVSAIAGTPI